MAPSSTALLAKLRKGLPPSFARGCKLVFDHARVDECSAVCFQDRHWRLQFFIVLVDSEVECLHEEVDLLLYLDYIPDGLMVVIETAADALDQNDQADKIPSAFHTSESSGAF